MNDTWKSSQPEGPGAVDVEDVVGGVGCEVVEDGFGPGGQGQVDRRRKVHLYESPPVFKLPPGSSIDDRI